MSIAPGVNLGPYRIIEQLGRGGMATVYKAFQPALDRFVAIKVLPEFFADEEGFRDRFEQEAITIAKLRHSNIVTVFDYGEDNKLAYVVTEYIDGGSLAHQLGQAHSTEYTVGVLDGVAAALDYAHSHGVIHRDVKPSNILLSREGTAVLADFGLARMIGSLPRLTVSGTVVGTPEYMAPEQANGDEVGPSADHYALAVVAYEMLTGSVPFSADTPLAVLLAHMQRPLPLPRSINPDLSERVEEVLLKGLAKTPPDRYPTASAFVAGLVEASRASLQPAGPRQWSDRARERPTDGSTPSASPRAGRVLPFNTAWLPRISVNRLRSTLHQLPRPSLTPPWVAGLAVAAMGVVAVGGVFLARGPLSRGGPSSPAEVSAAASAGGTLAGIPAGSGPTEPTTIILQDDFQNPSAGRLPPSSEVPWAANGYESGEYAIKADVYAPLPSAARIPGSYDTVWLSVDARIVGPTTTRTVILQCRAAALNGYQLEIEPDHSGFAVYRLDAGRKTPIVRPGTSDAIRTGNQTNRVELGCVGNTITARVNGTVLGSAEDGTYPHGSAFLATAAPGATSEVRFDNLLVKGHRLD